MDVWMCYRCGELPTCGARDTESEPIDACVCGGNWQVYDILDSELEEMFSPFDDLLDDSELRGAYWDEDTH